MPGCCKIKVYFEDDFSLAICQIQETRDGEEKETRPGRRAIERATKLEKRAFLDDTEVAFIGPLFSYLSPRALENRNSISIYQFSQPLEFEKYGTCSNSCCEINFS